MHAAAAGDRGTHCLGLIVLPLCNQEGLIWRDDIFPESIVNGWTHFHDRLYYFGFEELVRPLLLQLNDCEIDLPFQSIDVCFLQHYCLDLTFPTYF